MKRLLILQASKDICVTEVEHIETIAKLTKKIECEHMSIASFYGLNTSQAGSKKFDYIYLCGHADEQCFGEGDGSSSSGWAEFAIALCSIDWLNSGSVLFLATCRGGLNSIANTLFQTCSKIDYICGPRWNVDELDLTCGFHTFIYNMEARNEEPAVAVERASKATGRHFFCYDRLECCVPNSTSFLALAQHLITTGALNERELTERLFKLGPASPGPASAPAADPSPDDHPAHR